MSGELRTEPLRGRRRATISEVAAAAGVSAPTVSRVLTGSANVTQPTRDRVLAAIDELGYRPNGIARALSTGRLATIGAVVPFFTHPSAVQLIRGLIDGLRPTGMALTLYDIEDPHDRQQHIEAVTSSHPPTGTIVVALTPTPAELDAFRSVGTPTVFIDAEVPGFPCVTVDHYAGGYMATSHLIELGHRRIAFVGDDENNPFGFTGSAQHRKGYRAALVAAGLRTDPSLETMGAHGRATATRLTEDLLARNDPPTGIVAASDSQALGALDAARILGLRVPDDLSVVGFDDIEMSAHAALTTVRLPLEATGRMAGEILIAALDDPGGDPIHEQLPLELVVRDSTREPKTRERRKET